MDSDSAVTLDSSPMYHLPNDFQTTPWEIVGSSNTVQPSQSKTVIKVQPGNYPVMKILNAMNGIVSRSDSKCNIPRLSLPTKNKNRMQRVQTNCRESYADLIVEQNLLNWVVEMQKRSFSLKRRILLRVIKELINTHKLTVSFPTVEQRQVWLRNFLNSHRNLIHLKQKFNRRDWCCAVTDYLHSIKQTSILDNPMRVFYLYQIYFYFDGKTGKFSNIISNEPSSVKDKSQKLITVASFYSAAGAFLPSQIVYPINKLSLVIEKNCPKNWYYEVSETGLLNSQNFIRYIKKVNEKIQMWKIQTPIILFVDGKNTEIGFEALKFCNLNFIMLFNLQSDNSHVFHLGHIFLPSLKEAWRKENKMTKSENKEINTKNFAKHISTCFHSTFSDTFVRNAFKTSGLFPFKSNVDLIEKLALTDVDFQLTKYVLPTNSTSDLSTESYSTENTQPNDQSNALALLEAHLTENLLKQFQETYSQRKAWVGTTEALYLYNYWCTLQGEHVNLD